MWRRTRPLVACAGIALMLSSCRSVGANTAVDTSPRSAPARPAPPQTGPVASAALFDPAKGVVTEDDLDRLRQRTLAVPVLGAYPADVPATFADPRSGGRRHNAADILAPRGTLVLSADDGVIRRLSTNALGGITIYATDPEERFVYYYAHLDGYAPELRVDQRVQRGDVLGYVGTTGNAPANAPHLHFQITRLLDRDRLWDGVPIDPKPFLQLPGALR
jgi:peptidoglycan LD-endopeptidase LytH